MLNRGAVVVRPKQPYLDWAAALGDSVPVPDVKAEKTVYLLPGFENDEEGMDILGEFYEQIFEQELWYWYTDEDAWPMNRTLKLFLEWFDVEFHSIVEDLDEGVIEDEG